MNTDWANTSIEWTNHRQFILQTDWQNSETTSGHHLFHVPVVVVSSPILLKSRHHGSHARTRVKSLLLNDPIRCCGFAVLISVTKCHGCSDNLWNKLGDHMALFQPRLSYVSARVYPSRHCPTVAVSPPGWNWPLTMSGNRFSSSERRASHPHKSVSFFAKLFFTNFSNLQKIYRLSRESEYDNCLQSSSYLLWAMFFFSINTCN